MRAIWRGSLAFGLINIPVNVYPGSEEHALEFHLLHKKELSPIRFARFCKEEEHEVPYADIVKGFEYAPGAFVVMEDKDFKAANAKKTSTIEIEHFVHLDEIDPIYFSKPYFLEADKKAGKAYHLLNRALKSSKKVAIAHFVFRQKEHVGAIIPYQEGLLLIQMRYFSEIRPFEELQFSHEKSSAQELQMAMTLIDQLTHTFEPEKYHDTYIEDLMAIIDQKVKGQRPKRVAKQKESSSQAALDVMHLLKESLKETMGSSKKGAKRPLAMTPTPSPKKRSHRKPHA